MQATKDLPRWYILDCLKSVPQARKELQAVLDSHKDDGLDFYVPNFFMVDHKGKSIPVHNRTSKNYVFIYASENQLFQLKFRDRRELYHYNLLPLIKGTEPHHPYVDTHVIAQLKKIADINDDIITATAYVEDIVEGDKIRILTGPYAGFQATAITRNGSKYRDIVLNIVSTATIPLGRLQNCDFEIIEHGTKARNNYTAALCNRNLQRLHTYLRHYHAIDDTIDERQAAEETRDAESIIRTTPDVTEGSTIILARRLATLICAYTVTRDDYHRDRVVAHAQRLLDAATVNDTTRLLLLSALYGTTLAPQYHDLITTLVGSAANSTKGSQADILQRVSDYRQWADIKTARSQQRYQQLHTVNYDDADTPLWYAVIAHNKRTDAIRAFQSMQIPKDHIYNPQLKPQDPRDAALKDLLFVHTTKTIMQNVLKDHPYIIHVTTSDTGTTRPWSTPGLIPDFRALQSLKHPGTRYYYPHTLEYRLLQKAPLTTIPDGPLQGTQVIQTIHKDQGTDIPIYNVLLPHLLAISVPSRPFS